MSTAASRVEGDALARALEAQAEGLLPCVHCGFCLPACPTYKRLGDEADSPRGRLHFMQAVVEGRLDAGSDAFQTHIDRCLGCRACEPVCPSGVEYGFLLELARDVGARHRPQSIVTRALLFVFASSALRKLFFLKGRFLRALGLPTLAARLLPRRGILGSGGVGMAMLAATAPWRKLRAIGGGPTSTEGTAAPAPAPPDRGTVAILEGCVQQGLYGRVNAATVRVLEANGFQVVRVAGQECCGAMHAHGGEMDTARVLARVNVEVFEDACVDFVVVNAAGCGASMKEYGHLLAQDRRWAERAAAFSKKVRDVNELLASVGPRPGAPVPCTVAVDHPCHLVHAQRIKAAPLQVLAAVPGAAVTVVENADECCGGAGIYGLAHPELGGSIGGAKVDAVRAVGADVVATPNPGCMMQIGAELILRGADEGVVHPVELLDESYRRAGYYA